MLTRKQCEYKLEDIAYQLRYIGDANSDHLQAHKAHLQSLLKSYRIEYNKALSRREASVGI